MGGKKSSTNNSSTKKRTAEESIGTNAESSTTEEETNHEKNKVFKTSMSNNATSASDSTAIETSSSTAIEETIDDSKDNNSHEGMVICSESTFVQNLSQTDQVNTPQSLIQKMVSKLSGILEEIENAKRKEVIATTKFIDLALDFVLRFVLQGNAQIREVSIDHIRQVIWETIYEPKTHAIEDFYNSFVKTDSTDSSFAALSREQLNEKYPQYVNLFENLITLQKAPDAGSKNQFNMIMERRYSFQKLKFPRKLSQWYGRRSALHHARFFTFLIMGVKHSSLVQSEAVISLLSSPDDNIAWDNVKKMLHDHIVSTYGENMLWIKTYESIDAWTTHLKTLKKRLGKDAISDPFIKAGVAFLKITDINADDDGVESSESDQLLIDDVAMVDDSKLSELQVDPSTKDHFLMGKYLTYPVDAANSESTQIKCLLREKAIEEVQSIEKIAKFSSNTQVPDALDLMAPMFCTILENTNSLQFQLNISNESLKWAKTNYGQTIRGCGACCLRAVYMILTGSNSDVDLNNPEEKDKFLQFFQNYLDFDVLKSQEKKRLQKLLDAVRNRVNQEDVIDDTRIWGTEALAAALLKNAVKPVECVLIAGFEGTQSNPLQAFPCRWEGDEEEEADLNEKYDSATDHSYGRMKYILTNIRAGTLPIFCLRTGHFFVCDGTVVFNVMFPGVTPDTFFEPLAKILLTYKENKVKIYNI